ncbi:MAG TPA: hypothetical protein VHG71_03530 [Verrucomicrobiae bacterium]|nr:hypothetical protein [Verrucomicrobiae bacterium]
MIAMTTSSSIRVKPSFDLDECCMIVLMFNLAHGFVEDTVTPLAVFQQRVVFANEIEKSALMRIFVPNNKLKFKAVIIGKTFADVLGQAA